MMGSNCGVSVIVPARNEEQLLARCLSSILAARDRIPPSISVDIVVAVDSSTDQTWDIAQEMLQGIGTVVSTQSGIVGEVRALAAKTALARFVGLPRFCWLANTDADTSVPKTWLVDQLTLAAQGWEAVAGIVAVDTFEQHDPVVRKRFRETYLINADGSHPHVHGANLGVRGDAYVNAGGWSNLSTAEDHDLWRRLGRSGARKLASAKLRVVTSGRRVGRAPCGFADTLAAHNGTAA